jgi:hypothetical protein
MLDGLPRLLAGRERRHRDYCGYYLTIADLRLYWIIDWLTKGILDGIPKHLIGGFENVVNWRNSITAVREVRLAEASGG